jgi:hypothetical protein
MSPVVESSPLALSSTPEAATYSPHVLRRTLGRALNAQTSSTSIAITTLALIHRTRSGATTLPRYMWNAGVVPPLVRPHVSQVLPMPPHLTRFVPSHTRFSNRFPRIPPNLRESPKPVFRRYTRGTHGTAMGETDFR